MDDILKFAQIMTPILLGLGGWILNSMRDAQKTALTAQDTRLAQHEANIRDLSDKLEEFKEAVPQNYVMRDDYIRAIAGFDNKMDQLTREVSTISKKLSFLCVERGKEIC